MDVMFWVWLAVIVVTAVIELATMEVASIWFTFGAIIPFILAATNAVRWEIQLVIFVVLSAFMIASLRQVTKKFLLRNSNEKTNTASLIGQKHRMLERTDFETTGSVKINDVVWSAVAEKSETIEKGEIVEIVKIAGNKLIVKKVDNAKSASIKPSIEEIVTAEVKELDKETETKRTVNTKNSDTEEKVAVEKKVTKRTAGASSKREQAKETTTSSKQKQAKKVAATSKKSTSTKSTK